MVGILPDSLLRWSSSAKFRRHLLAEELVLVSPFNPEASFNAGNAMARNKYIYCMSDAAVVVHSGVKGGTWSGAVETLERQWVPVWIKPSSSAESGNARLMKKGGLALPEAIGELSIPKLLNEAARPTKRHLDLFESGDRVSEAAAAYSSSATPKITSSAADLGGESGEGGKVPFIAATPSESIGFYDLFLQKIEEACSSELKSPPALEKELQLTKTQLNVWLKRAVSEKKVKKHTRPVRYEWVGTERQRSIF